MIAEVDASQVAHVVEHGELLVVPGGKADEEPSHGIGELHPDALAAELLHIPEHGLQLTMQRRISQSPRPMDKAIAHLVAGVVVDHEAAIGALGCRQQLREPLPGSVTFERHGLHVDS